MANSPTAPSAQLAPDQPIPLGAPGVENLGTPSLDGLSNLMRELDRLRGDLASEDWVRLCRSNTVIAQWRAFLVQDPYTCHALTKPRGYPGDAGLMDFAYIHASVGGAVRAATQIGKAIYRLTSTEPLSISARRRADFVAHQIRSLAANRSRISVTSFASGHARELEALDVEDLAAIDLLCVIDSDQRSLDEVERCYGRDLRLRTVARNVLRIRPYDICASDLAYSAGLFDYLSHRQAEHALGIMASCVRPGGQLLVGNIAQDARNLGYCEAIMDWWMIPRSRAEILDLGATLNAREWRWREIRIGCFHYLLADRLLSHEPNGAADVASI